MKNVASIFNSISRTYALFYAVLRTISAFLFHYYIPNKSKILKIEDLVLHK